MIIEREIDRADKACDLQEGRKPKRSRYALRDTRSDAPLLMRLLRFQDEDGIGPFASKRALGCLEYEKERCSDGLANLSAMNRDCEDPPNFAFAATGEVALNRWFSADEQCSLRAAGFILVDLSGLPVVSAGENEAIVASRWPFSAYASRAVEI